MRTIALKRLCRCGKLIDYNQKYCDECSKKIEQERAESNRYYDKNVRDKRATTFYHSQEWLLTRADVLRKHKGLDLYAFFIEKKIVYADTVHHIEELSENWGKRLDVDNLFPTSDRNHKLIHKLYKKDKVGTQRMLKELLQKWKKEYGQGGGRGR